MKEFENCFLDSGIGDAGMRKNLHCWIQELAVIGCSPPETAVRYADAETLKKGAAILVLRKPAQYDDDEIFGALCVFGGAKIQNGAVIKSPKPAQNAYSPRYGVMLHHSIKKRKRFFYRMLRQAKRIQLASARKRSLLESAAGDKRRLCAQ